MVQATTIMSSFNWYGFLIGGGMVICIAIAYFMSKRRGYYGDFVFDIAICTIPLALVGARLYYVIFDAIANDSADWNFMKILGFENGKFTGLSGLAIYGGLIGAVLGSMIVMFLQRKKPEHQRITWWQMADLAFTVIILGQAIGRWGNFANQEAYGNPVTNKNLQWFPYAVYIDKYHSITGKAGYFQATFFYESFWNMLGFVLLMIMYNGKRKSFDGAVFAGYCVWYGAGRMVIEGMRSDSLWLIPNVIRVSQLVSLIIFIFGVAWIVLHILRAKKEGKKPLLFVLESELSLDYYGYEKTIFYKRTVTTENEIEPKKEPVFDEPDDSERYWEKGEDYHDDNDISKKYFGEYEEERGNDDDGN